jgi:hypothetical protein
MRAYLDEGKAASQGAAIRNHRVNVYFCVYGLQLFNSM